MRTLLALTLLALLGGLLVRTTSTVPAPPPVPALVLDYHDDSEDARIVGELRLHLEEAGPGRGRLVVEPSALGPRVQPVRGYRGVAGVNVRTARELGQLESEGRLSVATRPLGEEGAPPLAGTVRRGPARHLPVRELLPDGTLRHDARTPDAPPVSLRLASPALGEGRWTTEVRVDGRLRLAVDVSVTDGEVHILDVRGHRPALPSAPE